MTQHTPRLNRYLPTVLMVAMLSLVGANPAAANAEDAWTGDPYPLATDPVSGQPLAEVHEPIVVVHEGRRLNFVDSQTAAKFKTAPDKYLPAVDAKIIQQQTPEYPLDKCVVSGHSLTSMGKPANFVYRNRLFRFCCMSCKDKVVANPDPYVSKLNEAVVKLEVDNAPLTCAVSDEELGEMGEPVDYVIGTRLVRLCCNHCRNDVDANPAKYLADPEHPALNN